MKKLKKQENYNYKDLLESFELEIIISDQFGDYSGDYITFFRKDNKIGYLEFGYGSCSGCDELQACHDDYKKIVQLRNELYSKIQWKSAKEMMEFIENRDWEGCLSFYFDIERTNFDELLKKVKEIIIPIILLDK